MKIDNKDIVRMAQKLRDEENEQLNVRPWSRRPRFCVPAWLAAVPAAAIVGFLLGIWTNSHLRTVETGLTALVDTFYITMKDTAANVDTALSAPPPLLRPTPKHVRKSRNTRHEAPAATGQPIMSDRIRYDLLVKN